MFEALHRQPRRNPRIHMRRGRSPQPPRGHMDWGARRSRASKDDPVHAIRPSRLRCAPHLRMRWRKMNIAVSGTS